MSQTVPNEVLLNDPPMMGPPMDLIDPNAGRGGPPSQGDVAKALAKTVDSEPPTIARAGEAWVDLPGGLITPEGLLVRRALVRELNGYDEERLSRIDMDKNVAAYVTEMLCMAIDDLGGGKPTKETVRSLLIGDRDALVLGIRAATYGNDVEFKLSCSKCGNDSEVVVEIDKDIEITRMDDPLNRQFTVPLRRGEAKVTLLTGVAQEAFSADIGRRTQAEINTIMLAKSVISIDDVPVQQREEDVRRLSAADRDTLTDFIAEHQPGPQFKEIEVTCATCGAEYPVSLGLPTLFRF